MSSEAPAGDSSCETWELQNAFYGRFICEPRTREQPWIIVGAKDWLECGFQSSFLFYGNKLLISSLFI